MDVRGTGACKSLLRPTNTWTEGAPRKHGIKRGPKEHLNVSLKKKKGQKWELLGEGRSWEMQCKYRWIRPRGKFWRSISNDRCLLQHSAGISSLYLMTKGRIDL